MRNCLADALHSDGPALGRAAGLRLYGWLVGRWHLDVTLDDAGGTRRLQGSVHAGWVLEGRAIQDVFAVPGLFYGSTLRVYDPALDIWQVTWTDPLNLVTLPLTGRAVGSEIVNEGVETPSLARLYGGDLSGDGPALIRWIFSDITADGFRWRSERCANGRDWRLQRTYVAHRRT